MEKEKAISYRTEKSVFQKEFLKAWLLVPFFGLGYFRLKRLHQQIDDSEVLVYNDRIVAKEGTILISELKEVRVVSSPEVQKLKLCSVNLASEKQSITIFAIPYNEAEHLGNALSLAMKHEAEKRKLEERSKGDYADTFHIGGLEHMNSLVGLWQQGLISDEDFFTEQKKFKKE